MAVAEFLNISFYYFIFFSLVAGTWYGIIAFKKSIQGQEGLFLKLWIVKKKLPLRLNGNDVLASRQLSILVHARKHFRLGDNRTSFRTGFWEEVGEFLLRSRGRIQFPKLFPYESMLQRTQEYGWNHTPRSDCLGLLTDWGSGQRAVREWHHFFRSAGRPVESSRPAIAVRDLPEALVRRRHKLLVHWPRRHHAQVWRSSRRRGAKLDNAALQRVERLYRRGCFGLGRQVRVVFITFQLRLGSIPLKV